MGLVVRGVNMVEAEAEAEVGVAGARRGVRMANSVLVKQGVVGSGIQGFIRLFRLCREEVVVVRMLHVGRPGQGRLVNLRVLVVV
jgi:hypothetical protein